MIRNNAHQDEDEGTPDSSSPGGKRETKRDDKRVNAVRSKHSETEQRRRSKINERFQILMGLVPESDQKRDKASFLLEVIQYIQFLQERLQVYEGMSQDWSPEPTKLMPWRSNPEPVGSFIDQSQFARNGTDHEDNYIVNPKMLNHAQNSLESDSSGDVLCKPTESPHVAANDTILPNIPLQSNLFEDVSCQPSQGSYLDAEQLTPQSQSQFWVGKSCANESSVPIYITNEGEELKSESGEASISRTYSQGLLNNLTSALQSFGVDLSQASISVQLDICRRANSGSTAAILSAKDHENPSGVNSADFGDIGENNVHPYKRLRADRRFGME
ncbi:transcription factor BIM2-like [Olea europaea subsp. europaea]|uniref:Transcription factor BIM2-like n=1 Tax=Olea europaea subsp. europaea TaxID=158383 RepID=A0A8S0VIC8_OLEEU|nr:transcription factor BIM2-like [Olea europaea subsp. europaea]